MKLPEHPTTLRLMRDARVKQLAPRCPPLAASLGRQAGGGAHVTLKQAGKTRTVYVPKDLTEEVEASIREHQRLKKLLREITQIQLALIHSHRTEQAQRREGLELGALLATTMAHFWPDFGPWLRSVSDSRDQDRIVYPRQFLLWEATMGFLLKLGSRRQVRFELDSPEALENLNRLSGCHLDTLAHSDTIEHLLGHVRPESLERVRRQMVQRLLRMKALDDGRLLGYVLVVLDGTGQLHFRQRHCEHCLESTLNGQTHYYHNVLEAKLVTPQGLAISIGSEFIENADPNASKQDCELKAFKRLAVRLKRDYPQLRLCLLGDALYANGTFLSICESNSWKYIITFKEGSMPAVWQEYEALRDLCPQNRRVVAATAARPRQVLAFVDRLEYRDDQDRLHRFRAFECREGQGDDAQFFAWLTNFKVTAQNVATLANDGGRCRWKIENQGFNIQKNGGFNLEHAYSTSTRQIKNWYILLQIGHMILQLIECGSLLKADCKRLFGSLRTMARRLAESIRNRLIPWGALDLENAAAIQIRLHGSS